MFHSFVLFMHLINRNVIHLIITRRKLIFRKNRSFAFHVIRMWPK